MLICPLPRVWADIHQALHRAWERSGRVGPAPPVPLILAGWAYSEDMEKAGRWTATVRWAEERGLDGLIPELAPQEAYSVTAPSASDQTRSG